MFILQTFPLLVTFNVFEIRKNLDLRKILSTPKIFLKSRFHCTTYSNQLNDNFYCSANCNSATQYFAYAVKSKQNLNFWIFQQRNIWEFRGKNTTALGIRRADALHHYNVCHHYRVPQKENQYSWMLSKSSLVLWPSMQNRWIHQRCCQSK